MFTTKDKPLGVLECRCAETSEGRTALSLGPLWSAAIGSVAFVSHLIPCAQSSAHHTMFLQQILAELRCDCSCSSKGNQTESNGAIKQLDQIGENEDSLKRKAELIGSEPESKKIKRDLVEFQLDPAPPFYYNLHKHKPKDAQKLLKADKIIEALRHSGRRASRTHFDRAAVKTDATLSFLTNVITRLM